MAKGKKKAFLQEIASVEKVVEEEPELLVEEKEEPKGKMNKNDFLKSVGMHHRPGSHRAIIAYKEYLGN
tara:strand:- start:396 stop:602 length:207 start_codon:yes stop_codon:yes gene_type:complete